MTLRLAVLCSGRGSNLQAVLDAIAHGSLDAVVTGVFSDRPGSEALQRVPESLRWSARPSDFSDRDAFEDAMAAAITATRPDWVLCAGYMRILGDRFIGTFNGRMLNIHPSLLPRHRGLDTHRRALEARDTEHGASVHRVIPELDAGEVIAQVVVPVRAGDTPASLGTRVLAREHVLLVEVLRWIATGRLAERNGILLLDGHPGFTPVQLESPAT